MLKDVEIQVAGARIKISTDAMEACTRLLDNKDHYPGLKFTGERDSYNRLRKDIHLVAETLGDVFLELTKQIARHVEN
jgi:hypothetical protein